MNALYFSLGGVVVRLCADAPLGVGAQWAAFQVTQREADYTYLISHSAPQLPQGTQSVCGRGRLLISTPQADYRAYCDAASGKLFALTRIDRAEPRVCHVSVSPEQLPWGTRAEHFFEQLALPHVLLQKERLLLHGAYVLHAGRAIIFTAPSGTGKTTQAQLWKRLRGARIINGDRLILGVERGRVMAYGVPISGSSDECENVSAPVRAVAALSQARENRIAPCTQAQAVRLLISGTYLPPEYRDDLPAVLETADKIAQHAVFCRLACLPDAQAVQTLADFLSYQA